MKRFPFLTVALIAASVIVALITSFGADDDVLQWLFIGRPDRVGLEDIAGGQVWRLLTPLSVHFGPLHLLFNMMWLWDLGRMIEARMSLVSPGISCAGPDCSDRSETGLTRPA